MSDGLRSSTSASGSEKIRGHHRGLEIEWSQPRFAELIRRPVEHALALGLSPEEAWRRARSTYRVAPAFEDQARIVFDAVLLEQLSRHAGSHEKAKERR